MKNGKCEEKNKVSWYLNNQLHKEDSPAVEYDNGDKFWFFNGRLHREDDPAVVLNNGNKEWYLHGKLHCETGPAIDYDNEPKEWYLNGIQYTELEFNQFKAKKDLNQKLENNLSNKDKIKRNKL